MKLSEAFTSALDAEIATFAVNPQHKQFVEDKVLEALSEAKAKDEFLLDLGTFDLPGCSETKNLNDYKKQFKSYFSDNYKNWNLARPQQVLARRQVSIKEMQPGKNGNYQTIFDSMGRPLKEMVSTENGIIQILFSKKEDFVDEKEWEKIQNVRKVLDLENKWTHFILEVKIDGKSEFFVFYVLLGSDGFNLFVDRLDDGFVWPGDRRRRFVTAV